MLTEFNPGSIVEHLSHDCHAVIAMWIDGVPIMDFLPSISHQSKPDMQIMDSWREHFERKNIPFAVTKNRIGNFVLWKKDECNGKHEMGQ